MADEAIHKWILAPLIAAVVGLYGFFIKHIINHVRAEDGRRNAEAIAELTKVVQFRGECEKTVERLNEHHQELTAKMDRFDERQEKMNQSLHQLLGELRAKSAADHRPSSRE